MFGFLSCLIVELLVKEHRRRRKARKRAIESVVSTISKPLASDSELDDDLVYEGGGVVPDMNLVTESMAI